MSLIDFHLEVGQTLVNLTLSVDFAPIADIHRRPRRYPGSVFIKRSNIEGCRWQRRSDRGELCFEHPRVLGEGEDLRGIESGRC